MDKVNFCWDWWSELMEFLQSQNQHWTWSHHNFWFSIVLGWRNLWKCCFRENYEDKKLSVKWSKDFATLPHCLHLFCHLFADSVHPSSWNTIFICWYKESNFLFVSKLLCCFFFVSISSDAGKRFSILSNKSWIWRRGKFSKKLEINLWQIFWMTFISVLPLDWRI